MEREGSETELLIKPGGLFVLRIDHDRKNRDLLRGAQDSSYRIREQQFPHSLPANLQIGRKPTDERGGNRSVSGEFSGQFFRNVIDGEGEGTETVEPRHAKIRIDRDKHPSDIPFDILT